MTERERESVCVRLEGRGRGCYFSSLHNQKYLLEKGYVLFLSLLTSDKATESPSGYLIPRKYPVKKYLLVTFLANYQGDYR